MVVNRKGWRVCIREVGFGRLAGLAEGVLGGAALEGGGCRRRADALIWVVVVCEGRTERDFVMQIVGPELADSNVFVEARLIPTSPEGERRRLDRTTGTAVPEQCSEATTGYATSRRSSICIGLPSDFPGLRSVRPPDPLDRASAIEASLHEEVVRAARCGAPTGSSHTFSRMSSRHCCSRYTSQFARERARVVSRWTAELAAARRSAASPEHIDDGPDTHPSALPGAACRLPTRYVDGPAVAARIGLDRIRRRVPPTSAAWLYSDRVSSGALSVARCRLLTESMVEDAALDWFRALGYARPSAAPIWRRERIRSTMLSARATRT